MQHWLFIVLTTQKGATLLSSAGCTAKWPPTKSHEVPRGSTKQFWIPTRFHEVPRGSTKQFCHPTRFPRGSHEVPRGSHEVPRGSTRFHETNLGSPTCLVCLCVKSSDQVEMICENVKIIVICSFKEGSLWIWWNSLILNDCCMTKRIILNFRVN